jgi:hypothetical protein
MTKTIALCVISEEINCALERYGGCRILYFFDEPEQRGDVKLAYFLRDGPPGIERLAAGLLRARPPTEVGLAALLRRISTKITIQCCFKNEGIEQWRELWK